MDCSGLTGNAFQAINISLPRTADAQALMGEKVKMAKLRPGDLLFFTEGSDRITHVAIAGPDDSLVHSTVACGGFVVEPWYEGSRAFPLRSRLVARRRLQP